MISSVFWEYGDPDRIGAFGRVLATLQRVGSIPIPCLMEGQNRSSNVG